jgi:hypothetical protein
MTADIISSAVQLPLLGCLVVERCWHEIGGRKRQELADFLAAHAYLLSPRDAPRGTHRVRAFCHRRPKPDNGARLSRDPGKIFSEV